MFDLSSEDAVRDLKISVVLPEDFASGHALTRFLDFAPGAVFLTGPARPASQDRVASLIKRAERRVFPTQGQGAPVRTRTLDLATLSTDLVIDLRPGLPDPSLAARARFGVWQIAPLDLGALARGATAIPVALVALESGAKTPHLVATALVQGKKLLARSEGFAFEKAIQLIRQQVARLKVTGVIPDAGQPPASARPVGWRDAVGHLRRNGRVWAGRRHRKPFALRLGHGTPLDVDIHAMRDIPNPPGSFRADPFLFAHGGALFVFFEEITPGGHHGIINVARFDGDRLVDVGTALSGPHHLSFPYVFGHAGEIYMIPETVAGGRVEIWRATDFPLGWELHATALEGDRFADPVLFRHAGRWWFMASPTHDSIGDMSSEIWLFAVDGPDLKRLDPHPLNPVVVGSHAGRGAGRVFAQDGRLFRVAQDNTGPVYGYGIRMMEITALSDTDYQEREVRRITGDDIPGAIGTHHLDFAGGRVIADVRWP